MKQITDIKVYSSGSTIIAEPELSKAQDISFGTYYPCGLFGDASFTVPRKLTANWTIKPGYRIKFYNGTKCVWEGRITGWAYRLDQAAQMATIHCLGYWGDIMERRTWWKVWAITDLSEETWKPPASANGASDKSLEDMVVVSYADKAPIRFVPNPIAFSLNDYTRVVYTAPPGNTIKRIVAAVELQEDGQQWLIGLYNETSATIEDSTTVSTNPDNYDVTPATPAGILWFFYQSAAGQTATNFNTLHADVESCTLYGELGNINLTEITKDVAGYCTELSTYYTLVGSCTFSLIPFFSEKGETLADILLRAASFGDASYNAWAVGIRESDLGTDDKPVMFAEQYPVLTDYDYIIHLEDPCLKNVTFEQDITDVKNWIAYTYTDANGVEQTVTPDTDATLKDATSIAAYGQRDEWLSLNSTDSAACANYARRYLATKKDLQWRASSGIPVTGTIHTKSGAEIPVSQVRAGQRIKIANFLNDLNGTGLTFLITTTEYEDENQVNRLSVGVPNPLDVLLARNKGK